MPSAECRVSGVVLLALLLLPVAAASPATEPYVYEARFDAEPEVGRAVTLTVALEARRPIDAPLRLDVPEWIGVEEPAEWRAEAAEGERIERAWRVTATRAGFWRAGLAVDASRAAAYADPVDPARDWQPAGGCCLFAWSSDGRALHGARPEAAVPGESTVGFHTSFSALDAERAELAVRMSPQDRRYVGQELLLQVPLGSPEMQTAPADGPHVFTHAFPLRAGERALVSAAGYVRVTFEGGEHQGEPVPWSQHVACANIEVAREGDDVREIGRTGCSAAASRPRLLAQAPLLMAVLAAALAAAGMRPR